MTQAGSPPALVTPAGRGGTKQQAGRKSNKTPSKILRVLAALLHRSLNRFQAERELHDHVLPSTVAAIERQYGIRVDRMNETVPGWNGHPTRCVRYWIAEDQHEKAERVLRYVGLR